MEPANKTHWTDEMVHTLIDMYPTNFNAECAKMLGVSQRSVIRKARDLKLYKVPNFFALKKTEIIKKIKDGQWLSDNMAASRAHRFKKGVRSNPAGEFKKGESSKERMGLEHWKEVRERLEESRRRTVRSERAKAVFNLPQRTKLKFGRQSRSKVNQRCYLRKMGYIIDDTHGIAYWNDGTKRAPRTEKTSKFYKFKQMA